MVSASGRKIRNTASPRDQEDAIVDAAAAEFTEFGVRRASIDDIARRAQVSRSTLYRRFPNRESLLLAVATRLYLRGMRQLENAMVGLTPKEAVAEAFAVGAALIASDPLMHRLVVDDEEMRSVISSSVTAMFIDAVTDRTVATLRSLGATRADDELREVVELMIRLIISLLEVPSGDPETREPEYVRGYATRYFAPMVW
ncbi:TetR/AcrR family transcriptional regulator [Williamsia sp. CHRR-6]|nr:TetR/AcrR family transcriptional regulator [Williamsia sp. CHRR-6]